MWERIGTAFMALVAMLAILLLMHPGHHYSLSADSELRGLSDLAANF